MANKRKETKKQTKFEKPENDSFVIDEDKMPSFMHSLFDSEEKSGKMEDSRKKPSNLRISKIQVEKAREKLQRRNKPLSKALQEIKLLQNSTQLVCRRAGFQRFVKKIEAEVAQELAIKESFRYSTQSLDALQSLTEQYMIDLFEDAAQCTVHARRVTLMGKDLNLTARIRGIPQPTLEDIRNLKFG